jgi:hypothetical protein
VALLRPKTSKLVWLLPLALLAAIALGLGWRSRGRVELEGKLREGSLRCRDACHFELVLETSPETLVQADSCIMPDTLRDWPGVPVHVMAAGKWVGERRLKATALLTKQSHYEGPKPSSGRPPACFVPL